MENINPQNLMLTSSFYIGLYVLAKVRKLLKKYDKKAVAFILGSHSGKSELARVLNENHGNKFCVIDVEEFLNNDTRIPASVKNELKKLRLDKNMVLYKCRYLQVYSESVLTLLSRIKNLNSKHKVILLFSDRDFAKLFKIKRHYFAQAPELYKKVLNESPDKEYVDYCRRGMKKKVVLYKDYEELYEVVKKKLGIVDEI
jgi:hypothetical protein